MAILKKIAEAVQRIYRGTFKRVPVVSNTVFALKEKCRYVSGKYARYREPTWICNTTENSTLKLAVICDSLTWSNINSQFSAVYLTPSNWLERMEQFKPNIFFCEATWDGLNKCWDNQIYRNKLFRNDNRNVLKDILKYWGKAGIPTVFWNKEDAPNFSKAGIDFDSTALMFEHIFTTAEECVEKYKQHGHESVHVMMFGYSPELFYPTPLPDNRRAAFFGSWYADIPERCNDMCLVFDAVLSEGLELVIYDRASESNNPNLQYPEKYRKFIRKAVPYEQVRDEMAKCRYVININTVKDSRTMFARRVFEAMACGRIVISNESIGMRELFPGRVWFVGETVPNEVEDAIIEHNMRLVIENFTFEKQMIAAMRSAGLYNQS